MVSKAHFVKAIYQKVGTPQFDGNPFTEALYTLYCDDPNSKALRLPEIPEDYWDLPNFVRKSVITNLRNFFKPNELFSTLYTDIFSLILNSYSYRNPLAADGIRAKMEFAKEARETGGAPKQRLHSVTERSTALTILVHGLSGTGKTTSIRNALALIPQVILHDRYENQQFQHEQLIWLSIDMPVTTSIKALAANFYQAVDNALGTKYLEFWGAGKNYSVDRHLLAMQQIAQAHDIGIIHIDEMQWILGYARSPNAPTLVMLEALFNKIGIPVIMSCTNVGLRLFQSESVGHAIPDFTITRRMVSDKVFEFSQVRNDKKYYNELFSILFPDSLCKLDERSNEIFKQYFYYLSCGITDILARLAYVYHCTIDVLYEKGALGNYSSMQLLELVFKKDFVQISGALDLLRKGQMEDYEKALAQSNALSKQSNTDETPDNKPVKLLPAKKRKAKATIETFADSIPVGLGAIE